MRAHPRTQRWVIDLNCLDCPAQMSVILEAPTLVKGRRIKWPASHPHETAHRIVQTLSRFATAEDVKTLPIVPPQGLSVSY